MKYQILQGDNRETLKTIADNSVDAIVTDPPYGISFLGKDWDSFRNSQVTKSSIIKNLGSGMRMTTPKENLNFQLWCEQWAKECFRVLKPGGYILSFCAPRMYHRMTVGLEDAGFEIRDQIMWIYSSGFPKSQDVGKNNQMPDWQGWGTALKPAHEPIALARKPSKLSIAKNVQKWGIGALNIDASRVPVEGDDTRSGGSNGHSRLTFGEGITSNADSFVGYTPNEQGRFPSNVLGEIAEPYQKYFYCPKVSRKERHIGHEDPGPQTARERDANGNVLNRPAKKAGASANVLVEQFQLNDKGNNHPTVKPVTLMEYLIKLVTPPGGTVLDPFNGSGSTGMAATGLGYNYIGCELDPAYVAITEKRIEAWIKHKDPITASGLFD